MTEISINERILLFSQEMDAIKRHVLNEIANFKDVTIHYIAPEGPKDGVHNFPDGYTIKIEFQKFR